MSTPATSEVTQLLAQLSAGDSAAMARVMPLIYDELHRLAKRSLRNERGGHTLQATALVHEAYLRLVDQTRVRWRDRAHFLAVASQIMRRILVDHARARRAAKRGGAAGRITLERAEGFEGDESEVDLEALDLALAKLGELDPQQGRIVELRYFGGLSVEEAAEVVGLSPATLKREWATAKAWLRREIRRAAGTA
jgi:RNA polymerase sigma factor (TIGR02999 family)